MKQIRKYYDRLPKNNIESIPPRVFYQTFMGICKNVELLNLDVSKIEYVEELKGLFSELKKRWVDMKDYWSKKDKEYKKAIFSSLEKYLSIFDEKFDEERKIENLEIEKASLEENRKANQRAKRANIISIIALIIAVFSLVLTIIFHFY